MHGNKGAITAELDKRCGSPVSSRAVLTALALALNAVPGIARVDEGGISFWTPGTYGSLVAVPQQAPGWSLTTIFWHDSVSAGADVARARVSNSRECDRQRERQLQCRTSIVCRTSEFLSA